MARRDKAKDLPKRLENEAPDQALPAEYELALSWAVARIASLEIDKPMGSRTPDISSEDLLASGPLVVDVAVLGDVSLQELRPCAAHAISLPLAATSSTLAATSFADAVQTASISSSAKRPEMPRKALSPKAGFSKLSDDAGFGTSGVVLFRAGRNPFASSGLSSRLWSDLRASAARQEDVTLRYLANINTASRVT